MNGITVTLPDGSRHSAPLGSTPLDVARTISPRLAKEALVAKVNGELWDLTRPLEGDATLQMLTAKDPEALPVYRHSASH
jgi:threonyl-tRNA synthetase